MRTMLRSVRFWIVVLACAMPACCLAEDAGQDSIAQALVLFRAGKVKQAETVLRSVTAANPNIRPRTRLWGSCCSRNIDTNIRCNSWGWPRS